MLVPPCWPPPVAGKLAVRERVDCSEHAVGVEVDHVRRPPARCRHREAQRGGTGIHRSSLPRRLGGARPRTPGRGTGALRRRGRRLHAMPFAEVRGHEGLRRICQESLASMSEAEIDVLAITRRATPSSPSVWTGSSCAASASPCPSWVSSGSPTTA